MGVNKDSDGQMEIDFGNVGLRGYSGATLVLVPSRYLTRGRYVCNIESETQPIKPQSDQSGEFRFAIPIIASHVCVSRRFVGAWR